MLDPKDERLWQLLEKIARGERGSGPPYQHYEVVEEFDVDGFRYGIISDVGKQPRVSGDGFLVAPDGARCSLIWDVEDATIIEEVTPGDDRGWGLWRVGFPIPVSSLKDIEINLRAVIPLLKPKWEEWREKYGKN